MEGIMRNRLVALTLGLYLSFVVLGCKSKPADSTASNSNDSSGTSATPNDNTAASGSNTGSGSAMSNMKSQGKPEAPKPLIVPAGTVLTVRLGQSVGSKISSPGQ